MSSGGGGGGGAGRAEGVPGLQAPPPPALGAQPRSPPPRPSPRGAPPRRPPATPPSRSLPGPPPPLCHAPFTPGRPGAAPVAPAPTAPWQPSPPPPPRRGRAGAPASYPNHPPRMAQTATILREAQQARYPPPGPPLPAWRRLELPDCPARVVADERGVRQGRPARSHAGPRRASYAAAGEATADDRGAAGPGGAGEGVLAQGTGPGRRQARSCVGSAATPSLVPGDVEATRHSAQEEIFKQREDGLKRKDEELQESLIRFSKFLQDNDAKRARALKKAADERKLCEDKCREIGALVS